MTNYGKYILLLWLLVYNFGCGLTKPKDAQIIASDGVIEKNIENIASADGTESQDLQINVQSSAFDESSPYIALALTEGWYGGMYTTPLGCYVRCVGGAKGVNVANFAFDIIFSSSVGGLAEQMFWENSEEGAALINHIRTQFRELNNGKDYHIGGSNTTQYIYASLSEVVIIADTDLWGVESGNNLVDKFLVTETAPSLLFSFPNGDVLNTSGRDNLLAQLSQTLTPLRIRFALTEPFAEKPEVVVYTVKVTFNNETTFESKFNVNYEYK